MAPKKKIEQKPHEYKRDMRSYFALPKQQASRASTTNAQSASAPSRDQNNEDNSDDLVIVASDVEEEIFDTVAVSISTTDRPTPTIRCSPDGDRKRKAIAANITANKGGGQGGGGADAIEIINLLESDTDDDDSKDRTDSDDDDSEFEDEDFGVAMTTAWLNCSEELQNNEDTTKPDMLTKTFCHGGIHDVKATGQHYIANRATMNPKQVYNWKRYFHWLGFDPDHPDEFKTCHDLIKEAHPDWTDDKIANQSLWKTKKTMKELGYSGTTGWDLHHLLLQAMGGLDNPMNLLPLKKPNHMGVHLMLPLNFRNYVLSKPNLYVSEKDIARLSNANEDDLNVMTEAYSMACTCKSIAMRGNTFARGQNQALDANHATNDSWSHDNRFDAALINISEYPYLSRPKFLKQTKLAPDLSYKYECQLNRMIQKIKKQGIDVMKPTSDAAKAAYTKLKSTPSILRLYFDRAKAGRKFQNI